MTSAQPVFVAGGCFQAVAMALADYYKGSLGLC
ncbi:hypothetical protein CIPOMM044M_24935 [Citrobacter portucalensis]